jgi:hypothetical protein
MLNLADVVFRVGRAYGMTADRGIYQAGARPYGLFGYVGMMCASWLLGSGPGRTGTKTTLRYGVSRA